METRKKALKAQEASKDTSKAEWVMCSVCDSWAKLQDTAFSTIEEANAAPDYKCRQCTKLNSFREEMMTLVMQASESNKLAIADLRLRLEEETATRRREGEHLEALLRVEKTRNAELAAKVALLEQPSPSLTPISMMDSKGTEMTAQKTPPEHRLRAGKCDGRRGQRWCLAGRRDMLNDQPPTDSAKDVQTHLQAWLEKSKKHMFVIYAIPEMAGSHEPVNNKSIAWNDAMQQICRELGPRVEFVTTNRFLRRDSLAESYSADMAQELGQSLGRRLCVFLGLRSGAKKLPQSRWRKQQPAVNPFMEAFGQALLQMMGGDHVQAKKGKRGRKDNQ
ncbi:hypothetical protein MTO96_030313 [Rhipicephalus appendiculatus]